MLFARGRVPAGLVVTVLLGWSTGAGAHTALLEPPARYERTFQKSGPCGHPDNPSGEPTATYAPGETITVRWEEFIGHPGHFRIAFSAEGDDSFVDPVDYDDFYPAENVLVDDIADPDGQLMHELEITLPDTTCERCVLQLIQVMTDKPPWGPEGGNELYYQCADIALVGDAQPAEQDGTGPPEGESSGCRTGGSPGRLGLLFLIFGFVRQRQ
jgi:hypothetical protein